MLWNYIERFYKMAKQDNKNSSTGDDARTKRQAIDDTELLLANISKEFKKTICQKTPLLKKTILSKLRSEMNLITKKTTKASNAKA